MRMGGLIRADNVISKIIREIGGPVAEMPRLKSADADTPEEVTEMAAKKEDVSGEIMLAVLQEAATKGDSVEFSYPRTLADGTHSATLTTTHRVFIYGFRKSQEGKILLKGWDMYYKNNPSYKAAKAKGRKDEGWRSFDVSLIQSFSVIPSDGDLQSVWREICRRAKGQKVHKDAKVYFPAEGGNFYLTWKAVPQTSGNPETNYAQNGWVTVPPVEPLVQTEFRSRRYQA